MENLQWKIGNGEFSGWCSGEFAEAWRFLVRQVIRFLRHIVRIGGGVLSETPPGDRGTSVRSLWQ